MTYDEELFKEFNRTEMWDCESRQWRAYNNKRGIGTKKLILIVG